MPQATIDPQAIAQFELSQYIEQQAQDSAYYEIDSVDDIFGDLYRVWGGEKGINLLGTFYQNLGGLWVAQPCNSDKRFLITSDEAAIQAILQAQ